MKDSYLGIVRQTSVKKYTVLLALDTHAHLEHRLLASFPGLAHCEIRTASDERARPGNEENLHHGYLC